MPCKEKIRVLIADDQKIFREGLRALLEKESDVEVAGEAENGARAVELAEELSPDVVIMDVTMPVLNGMEATHKIRARCKQVRVIALSVHSDKRFVAGMIEAGASGYLLKECAYEELVKAIRAVLRGKICLTPRIAHAMRLGLEECVSPAFSSLTPRQREVLQLLAEGKSTKETASHLNVSVKTVETHRKHIMEKLDLHSIAELTKFAIKEGLTSLNS